MDKRDSISVGSLLLVLDNVKHPEVFILPIILKKTVSIVYLVNLRARLQRKEPELDQTVL